jgi:hypothetical protein
MVKTMTYDVYLGQGDARDYQTTISDAEGPVNLSVATSLKFDMETVTGEHEHSVTCTGTAAGVLTIPITSTETANEGIFCWQILLTIGGKQVTLPPNGYGTMYVLKKLISSS